MYKRKTMKTKNLFLTIITLVAVCACTQKGRFHVRGHMLDAADTVMYLEHLTLGDGVQVVDSVRLTEKGDFHLSGDTLGNPEFYRLRIGGQCVNLAFDSTETVNVEASLRNMSFGYHVEGSGACDTIRLLGLKLAELERRVDAIAENRDYTIQERSNLIDTLLRQYKTEVKHNIIQHHYASAASYFACFQMLRGNLLFNPMEDRSDLTWLSAVANAWNESYPGCQRTENLFNIVTEAKRRQAKPRQMTLDIDGSKVRELGIIDLTFPDIRGVERTLSDLRGKVVLLDVTALTLQGSQERILQMRELYNEFHAQGLEIYQVSVDPDYHVWTQLSENLPWISVYCREGIQHDKLQLYQVQMLPSFFLIDRNCDLHARMENIRDLRAAIRSLLK